MNLNILLRNLSEALEDYHGEVPLSRHLGSFFKSRPFMGARDRRETRALVYQYFRLGKALPDVGLKERLSVAMFLCCNEPDPVTNELLPMFGKLKPDDIHLPVELKLGLVSTVYPSFQLTDLFPFNAKTGDGVDENSFRKSLLVQPDLWIRVRKHAETQVAADMKNAGISFEQAQELPLAWRLPPSVNVSALKSYENGLFEIQDYSSQATASFFAPTAGEYWCDACAASGGKSLLLLDLEPDIRLMATDVRPSILKNYAGRLNRAGYRQIRTEVHDLSESSLDDRFLFDAVLLDVPCSGSGTWPRTPERLTFFNETELAGHYVPLQRSILSNAFKSLRKGGKLIYCTCSVFMDENEGNIDWFLENYSADLVTKSYLTGYDRKADSMFVSVLLKR